jgi:hypothetical protein
MTKLNVNFPFYILLLPVFFVWHGLNENYVPLLVLESIWLLLIYTGITILLTTLCWLLLKDWPKAALAAFMILAIQFFFGSAHDFLRARMPGSLFVRYSFILPVIFIGFVALLIWLKRTARSPVNTTRFLNLLFLLLTVMELIFLLPKIFKKEEQLVNSLSNSFIACDTCTRPDVHLVIADEYAGDSSLKEIFSFDNSEFEEQLRARGFYLAENPISNYNATVYSMASLLNMDYIGNLESRTVNHRDMLRCRGLINHNQVVAFFKTKGYQFYNHSYFELDGKEKLVYNPFYPTKRALFTAQTFTSRFRRNLGFHFASRDKLERIVKHHLYNNRTIESATQDLLRNNSSGPKFVYTHLAMPHHPYYFDSTGKEAAYETLTEDYKNDRNAYIGYLKYANKRLLNMVDSILHHSVNPPVIILVSDHGFRQLPDSANRKYFFQNFNAVLLPGKNYSGFYEGISNVNEFRVILNSVFGQKLPILSDSTVYYEEPRLDF